MRAINLIPAEERRGGGPTGGRSGGAVYAVLGVLALLAIVVSVHTYETHAVASKRAELVQVQAQAATSEARAAELSSFIAFAGVRAARTSTVTSLAASRFDWSHALAEVARVIPANVTLTGLQGTVAPGVALKASAGSATGSLRSSLPVPALELAGCTTDQDAVATMLTRMRLIDGVTRVSLQASTKADAKAGAGQASNACQRGKSSPQFALVVFLDQAAGAVPSKPAGAGRISAAQFTPSGPTGATGPAAPIGGTP